MQIRKREHNHIVAFSSTITEAAALQSHGVWTRRARVGGIEHEKAEYLHIFSTDDPERFLIHLVDGDHWSFETRESVDDMREDFEARG